MHRKDRLNDVLAIAALFVLTAALRLNLLGAPLERDEGEYAYAAQLIMNGMHPYVHLHSLKLPGIFWAYVGIMKIFGETAYGIHLGLLLLSFFTSWIIYLTACRYFGLAGGFAAAAAFAVLTIGQPVMGVFTHSEHFVIAAAAVGFYLLVKNGAEFGNVGYPELFCSGLAFGCGFLMKQHGAAFMLLGAGGVVFAGLEHGREYLWNVISRGFIFALGCAIPYLLICLWFSRIGVFDPFWFWTVDYARAYVALVPIGHAWNLFIDMLFLIIGSAPLVWAFVALGAAGLVFNPDLKKVRPWLLSFLMTGFLAILPGFYFRGHYFLLLFPSISLIFGSGILSLERVAARLTNRRKTAAYLSWLLAALCIAHSVYAQRQFLFFMTPDQASRSTYGLNPFPESVEISRYLSENTLPGESIAVFGSEPQIYFYAKRRAVTGHIYMYPMMESHGFAGKMQEEFLKTIESSSFNYLVYVNVVTSWLSRPQSPPLVFQWLKNHASEFSLVGLADIHLEGTRYSWHPSVDWPPESSSWVAVLKRKNRESFSN